MNVLNTQLEITIDAQTLQMHYGVGVLGPQPEYRTLDSIRPSLMDPLCSGPDPVYSIAMDVRLEEDEEDLKKRYLLFGVVAYAAGRLGQEPVRSQGHVHAIAPHSGWPPPELFEIWEGKAIIYAQQFASDHPGRCFAISAGPGEKVVVPPGWAHAAINADPGNTMVFGAVCDRQYGFEYTDVRGHGGLAWFPVIEPDGSIGWKANSRYEDRRLQERRSRTYPELDLDPHQSLYAQYRARPESLEWVAQPQRYAELWPSFEP
ncbi:MAG: glucose-6-phosphate isomerase family protein [Terracidiphilus sp.]